MPKLKKKRNVPSQRKPKRVQQASVSHNDHTYSLPFEEFSQTQLPECNIEVQEETVDCTRYTAEAIKEVELACYEETITSTECPESNVECIDNFDRLKKEVMQNISSPYVYHPNNDSIQIVQLYPSADTVSVKLNVTINREFIAKVYVHKIQLSPDHDLWIGLPKMFHSVQHIQSLLGKLQSYSVCPGNFEADLIVFIPVGTSVQNADGSTSCQGFREGDFGAVKVSISYSSTVRDIKFSLLVQGNRCSPCSQLRRALISRKHRRAEKEKRNKENMQNKPYQYVSPGAAHQT